MNTNGLTLFFRRFISRSWTRAAAHAAVVNCLGLATLVGALTMPQKAEAVNVTWGNPEQTQDASYTLIPVEIVNDNQGTSYTSAQINSFMQLVQAYGMNPTGTTGGNSNVAVGINSDDGYVNQGWNASINNQGQIGISITGGRNVDEFNYGDVFFLTVGINNDYLVGLGYLRVASSR